MLLPALPTDLAEDNTPCASSTFVLNLHLLALVLPFPFPCTGRPLDCAFFPKLVGSVIPKVRLHPRHCPPAACCAAAALLLDRLVRAAALETAVHLSRVCTLYHDFTFSFLFPFPNLSPTLDPQAPNL